MRPTRQRGARLLFRSMLTWQHQLERNCGYHDDGFTEPTVSNTPQQHFMHDHDAFTRTSLLLWQSSAAFQWRWRVTPSSTTSYICFRDKLYKEWTDFWNLSVTFTLHTMFTCTTLPSFTTGSEEICLVLCSSKKQWNNVPLSLAVLTQIWQQYVHLKQSRVSDDNLTFILIINHITFLALPKGCSR